MLGIKEIRNKIMIMIKRPTVACTPSQTGYIGYMPANIDDCETQSGYETGNETVA